MRQSTETLIAKIEDILIGGSHLKAGELAKHFHVKPCTIYRAIRLMREVKNVGVHSIKTGYCLSECASKKDDVNFLRRLMGQRTSGLIALQASQPYIEKRWKGIEQRRQLLMIVGPLSGSTRALQSGFKVISNMKVRG